MFTKILASINILVDELPQLLLIFDSGTETKIAECAKKFHNQIILCKESA